MARITLRFYRTPEFVNANIEEMDISDRTRNALLRNGFKKIGDILDRICTAEDLGKLKGIGTNVRTEILEKMSELQIELALNNDALFKRYITEMREINGHTAEETF